MEKSKCKGKEYNSSGESYQFYSAGNCWNFLNVINNYSQYHNIRNSSFSSHVQSIRNAYLDKHKTHWTAQNKQYKIMEQNSYPKYDKHCSIKRSECGKYLEEPPKKKSKKKIDGNTKKFNPNSEEALQEERKQKLSNVVKKAMIKLNTCELKKNEVKDSTKIKDQKNNLEEKAPIKTGNKTQGRVSHIKANGNFNKQLKIRNGNKDKKYNSISKKNNRISPKHTVNKSGPSKLPISLESAENTQKQLEKNLIGDLMSLSKENLKQVLTDPKTHPKIGLGMAKIVKENRLILAQKFRKLAESKMNGQGPHIYSQFVSDMGNLIDPDLAVNVCQLPTVFIKQLSDIFQLDYDSKLMSETFDNKETDLTNKAIIGEPGHSNTADISSDNFPTEQVTRCDKMQDEKEGEDGEFSIINSCNDRNYNNHNSNVSVSLHKNLKADELQPSNLKTSVSEILITTDSNDAQKNTEVEVRDTKTENYPARIKTEPCSSPPPDKVAESCEIKTIDGQQWSLVNNSFNETLIQNGFSPSDAKKSKNESRIKSLGNNNFCEPSSLSFVKENSELILRVKTEPGCKIEERFPSCNYSGLKSAIENHTKMEARVQTSTPRSQPSTTIVDSIRCHNNCQINWSSSHKLREVIQDELEKILQKESNRESVETQTDINLIEVQHSEFSIPPLLETSLLNEVRQIDSLIHRLNQRRFVLFLKLLGHGSCSANVNELRMNLMQTVTNGDLTLLREVCNKKPSKPRAPKTPKIKKTGGETPG